MVLVIAAVVIAHEKLTPQTFELVAVLFGLLGMIALVALLYWYFEDVYRQRQRLRALQVADIQSMSGLDFEKYVGELLRVQGYADIRFTEKYDLGVDIIAVKDNIRWGIQVKRYSDMVKAEAVRQVVTALNQYNCQRAMVVTNNIFSRPARTLAASNQCVLVGRDALADWIVAFQNGSKIA